MYYRDEVGNISTSKAFRDSGKKQVKLHLEPRFSLLGGWKSNWEVGYNLDTKGFLMSEGNNFESKLKGIYALNSILTENYSIKVILPEGVRNFQIKIGNNIIDKNEIEEEISFGYLDFEGRPTFTITNLQQMNSDTPMTIYYEFDNIKILKKPALIFGTIFVFLLLSILVNRVKLEAFSEKRD